MAYLAKVSIPSVEGTFTKILSDCPLHTRTLQERVGVDNYHTFLVLQCSWVSLLADSCLERKPNRVINSFLNKLTDDPVGVISHYSDLAHRLRKSIKWVDGVVTIDSFLTEMKNTPIFREYLHFYRTVDLEMLRYLLSFLELGKKTTYTDQQLDTTAFRGWYEVEKHLSQLSLPLWTKNLLSVVEAICDRWEFEAMLPKHGSGAVAQRGVRGTKSKNDNFYLPRKIAYLYYKQSSTTWDSHPRGDSACSEEDGLAVSRLHFVPKTYKTSRSICMEPIPYMWAQQSCRYWLERAISDGILKRHVTLKDQGTNQLLSQFGSIFESVDTIDLSSASDSVSWELVKIIFPPKVLKHLLATRTRDVNVADVVTVRVNKFAPMGSAVCFPVQSIIYAAVVIYVSICKTYGFDQCQVWDKSKDDILRLYDVVYPRHRSPRFKDLNTFACYGDDIICDHRITSDVVLRLEDLGFMVNNDKSFTGDDAFRESCGEEFAAGINVSPFKLKLRQLQPRINIETLGGIIDQINLAYDYGYMHLRRHLLSYALHVPIEGTRGKGKNRILFSSDRDDSFSVFHESPRNNHLRKRFFFGQPTGVKPSPSWKDDTSLSFQRDEVESIHAGATGKVRYLDDDDHYRYTLYWRNVLNSDQACEDLVPSSAVERIPDHDTMGTGVARRWTAAH